MTEATIEDALHCSKSAIGLEVCEECRLYRLCHTFCEDAQRMIVEAMAKQIPKKLIGGFKCASCGDDVTETCYHIDFCPFCGQKLDWSEV